MCVTTLAEVGVPNDKDTVLKTSRLYTTSVVVVSYLRGATCGEACVCKARRCICAMPVTQRFSENRD